MKINDTFFFRFLLLKKEKDKFFPTRMSISSLAETNFIFYKAILSRIDTERNDLSEEKKYFNFFSARNKHHKIDWTCFLYNDVFCIFV